MNRRGPKRIRAILAFDLHRALDPPEALQRSLLDGRVASARVVTEGADPDARLGAVLALQPSLGGPITLASSVELLQRLEAAPTLRDALVRAFARRDVRPLYAPAHHASAALLSAEELVDELRLDEEWVRERLGAPAPLRRGALTPARAVEERDVAALEAAGIDFVLCAPAAPRFEAFRVGERLVALPLSDVASAPAGDDYAEVLARAVRETPDGGLLVVVQSSPSRVASAWPAVAGEVELIGADEALAQVTPHWLQPGAQARAGVSSGQFLATTLGWLVDAFGLPRAPRVPAAALAAEQYRLERLPPRVRVPLLYRMARREEGFDPAAPEGAQMRPYLEAFLIADALAVELALGAQPAPPCELPSWALTGLSRALDRRVDAPVDALWSRRAPTVGLARARLERERADGAIERAREALAALAENGFRGRAPWSALVAALRDHFGAALLAMGEVRRARELLDGDELGDLTQFDLG
jgi:hypothetical protein